MKFLLLCLFLFSSSMAMAARPLVDMGKLEQNLSDSLDEIITCHEDGPPLVGNALGYWLGLEYRLWQERAPYYDKYIYPAIEAVKQSSDQSADFRELAEYKDVVGMSQYADVFAECPEKVPAFMFALDALLTAHLKLRRN